MATCLVTGGVVARRHDLTGARFVADSLADPRIAALLTG
jgi:hypothetical protein